MERADWTLGASSVVGKLLLHRNREIRLVFLPAFLFLSVFFLHAGGQMPVSAEPGAMGRLPGLFLWAWERPESFAQLDVSRVGVAFLGKTIILRSDRVLVSPRLQPLVVPRAASLIAVARIEIDRRNPPRLSPWQIEETCAQIASMARSPNVRAVQVDFDARQTERRFYRDLLTTLRGRLPPAVGLSMTALASWCIGDNWIDDLPVDEAVPMMFAMGADRQKILLHFQSGRSFNCRLCRGCVGISVAEPLVNKVVLPSLLAGTAALRVYVFNPVAWSRKKIEETEKGTHAHLEAGVWRGEQRQK